MSWLPPLTNLIAAWTPDPARAADLEERLRQAEGARVLRPAPGWVVSQADLPKSPPAGAEWASAGWFFAEGRQRFENPSARAALEDSLARAGAGDHRAIAELPGDFGFVRLGPAGQLTVVRSCGGLVPFYVWDHDDGMVVSTTATPLVTLAGHDLEPDPVVTAIWLTGWPCFPRNRSHLAGVQVLGKGESFNWQRGRPGSVNRYWFPPSRADVPRPTPATMDEHARELRAELVDGLRANLDPAGDNLLSHSGGADSTCLLALASRHLGLPVRTISLVPPADAENLAREMGYLRDQQVTYGVAGVTEVVIRSEEEQERYERLPPVAMPVLSPSLVGLTDSPRPTVHFGGELADEVVGSRVFTIPDVVAMTSRWRWPELVRTMPRTRRLARTLLRSCAGRSRAVDTSMPASLPAWFAPSVRAEFGRVDVEQRRHWRRLGVTRAANPTLFVRTVEMDFQAMQWEACSAGGVRRYNPFATRDVLEIALRSHPRELVGQTDKLLLRRALTGLVESHHLLREDTGSFGIPPSGGARPAPPLSFRALAALMTEDEMSPLHRLVVTRCDLGYATLSAMAIER